MKTKKTLTLLLTLLFVSTSFAVNLRGKVRGYNAYSGYFPYVSTQVKLYYPGQQRPIVSYTDKYGMYYFYNIPPGRYRIQIETRIVDQIVYGTPAWQDIPVVTFERNPRTYRRLN